MWDTATLAAGIVAASTLIATGLLWVSADDVLCHTTIGMVLGVVALPCAALMAWAAWYMVRQPEQDNVSIVACSLLAASLLAIVLAIASCVVSALEGG